MDGTSITTALSSVQEIVTSALGIITGNPILMVMFCGGLLGVGFRAIKQAKRTAE